MKHKPILIVATFVVVLSSPFVMIAWEKNELAHAKTFTEACRLFGKPSETIKTTADLKARIPGWTFHSVKSGLVTSTAELPTVEDRTCIFQGRLGMFSQYLVYIEGDRIERAYFIGAD